MNEDPIEICDSDWLGRLLELGWIGVLLERRCRKMAH